MKAKKVINKYVYNGTRYNSIEEMPEEIQKYFKNALEDKDGNGVPDIVDEGGSRVTVKRNFKIIPLWLR